MRSKAQWVRMLEAACKKWDIPEYWRMRDGVVEVGYHAEGSGGHTILWKPVPFLSTLLLARHREMREREADGIPF